MNTSPSNIPSDILSAWTALEVLSPQTFRKREDLAGANGSIVNLKGPTLPWENGGEPPKEKYKRYYQIVLGTLNFPEAITALLNKYVDQRVEMPQTRGEAILALMTVNDKGVPIEHPAINISSFAWALPKAIKGDLHGLSNWNKEEEVLRIAVDEKIRRMDENGRELPIDWAGIITARQYIIDKLGLEKQFLTESIFAVRSYVWHTSPDPPEPILLNSFFLGDLATASELFANGKATTNLQRYVGMLSPKTRYNLLDDNSALEQVLAPSLMSPARWPGPGRHPLVVLQQAAVNISLDSLKNDGMLAVNGPPGTGKTTLLRDMIAGLINKRAEAMSAFDDPSDAFADTGERVSAGAGKFSLYQLASSIKGHEMLIASSNNKAVENVSAELPGLNAIADDIGEFRYFTSLSDSLLERETWGLIAAVLGNSGNRVKFKQRFWWDKETGLSAYLSAAAGFPQFVDEIDPVTGKVTGTRNPRIIDEDDAPDSRAQALDRWQLARERFEAAMNKCKSQLEQLEKTRKSLARVAALEKEEANARRLVKALEEKFILAEESFAEAKNASDLKQQELQYAEEQLKSHFKNRPGFWPRLFGRPIAKAWRIEHEENKNLVKLKKNELKECNGLLQNCIDINTKAASDFRKEKDEAERIANKLSLLNKELMGPLASIGPHLIDRKFFQQRHEKRHIVSPWCNEEMQRLRDVVFIESIRLHKAFIDAVAKPIRHNLGILMMRFGGKLMPDEEKQDLMSDLWSTLFLVVPAVSTTFASVERMLGKLPPESLGWLLIDEAGQALPQAAVGAIMRTKRAVVVGDPLQIEPVVTLPETLTQNICRAFNIDPLRFNAPEASVQTLADAATAYYAEFETKYGSRSVGVPLLVHRRCADPMFSISNAIAYERQMVQAKRPGNSTIRNVLGESKWINIKGDAEDKWCAEEGAVVMKMLQKMRQAGVMPDLYIVTPFVIVANNLRMLIRDSGILQDWVENVESWPYERIGTVHTVQGREAEAVIFVLGAPMEAQNGARGWAGGSPNLLNVAITRAKEVLYVVGNRELWKRAGVFGELSERLG
ncbi:MAG: hypothetical protein DI535_23310 [Citrobacter freundii]|nr:MAG: hypothetical protein DI535_23310 [Citrobacter freundii]